jgi:hypothetical protein
MLKNVKIIRSSDERLIDAVISNLSTKNLDDFELGASSYCGEGILAVPML